jgi:OOP family OmpA-OmpF porin
MNKYFLSVAAVVTLAAAPFVAQASEDNGTGAFIGASVGRASFKNTGFNHTHDTAPSLFGGYRWGLSDSFAIGVEGGYVDLGNLTDHYNDTNSFSTSNEKDKLESKALLVGANAKWMLPAGFSLTGRLGLAHSRVTLDENFNEVSTSTGSTLETVQSHGKSTDNGLYAGLGLGYAVTEHVNVSLNYDRYALNVRTFANNDKVNVGVFGVSAEYRF